MQWITRFFTLCGALVLCSALRPAAASVTPVEPGYFSVPANIKGIDRAAIPGGRFTILDKRVVAFSESGTPGYGKAGFVCGTGKDSEYGSCEVSLAWSSETTPTAIQLRFTEERSHMTRDLVVKGTKIGIFPASTSCDWAPAYKMSSAISTPCTGGGATTGTALNLWIDYAELKKLPVGGVWKARLKLYFWTWSPRKHQSSLEVFFRIDLTDKANIQAWLPQFGKGQPQLDLNLRPQISGGTLTQSRYRGQNSVDMCLYDGYGTNSSNLQLQFSAAGGGEGSENFLLQNADGQTLPYQVEFAFSGDRAGRRMVNGATWTVENAATLPINWNRILPVSLPDISVPVLCWPARLTLRADLPADTPAGQYRGVLRMVFTPSAAAL